MNRIRHVLMAALLAMTSMSVQAQDLLARQAPADKRISALDSITLHRGLPRRVESNLNAPSEDLYPYWNNSFVSNYGVPMPKEYKIDLRHFCMPCDSRLVTSHYGYRASFRRNHYGTDIKLYVGDTVRAAFDGKVRVVANEGLRKGYGLYVIIRHDNGLETVYGHLSKHLCVPNQIVKAGQVIALGGNTGRSTGSHLHFETRLLGQCIDPELLFDFQAHDALGDFYVYRSNGRSGLEGGVNHAEAPMPMLASEPLAADQPVASASSSQSKDKGKSKDKDKKKEKSRSKIHSVKQGDTLYGIARKYNTTVAKLCKLNHIKENATLRLGQVLKCS